MEITLTPTKPRESRTPLWLVIAAATVATAAALTGQAFAEPSNDQTAPPAAFGLATVG